jgi:hypothetical protein
MRALRVVDGLAAVAAIALAVLMFGPWFSVARGATRSGWSSLGWAADVLIALAVLGGLAVFATIASARAPSVQVVSTVGATVAAGVSLIAVAVRVVSPPGLGLGASSPVIDVRARAYLALGVLAALALACWRSMADERTSSRGSVYVPPRPRPAPPP